MHVARPSGKRVGIFLSGERPFQLPLHRVSRYADVMRRRRISLILLALAIAVLGVAGYVGREPLRRQWTLYRIGAAASPQEAEPQLVRCQTGGDRDAMIAELVRKWGTGNRQFDLYLAGHVSGASCGERLREAFAAGLGQRDGLLERWAQYWTWHAPLSPDEQLASVVAYCDTLLTAGPHSDITWREVLDLQALFQLTGCGDLARGLSPADWRDRYRQWCRTRPAQLPHVSRPEEPLP